MINGPIKIELRFPLGRYERVVMLVNKRINVENTLK